MHDEKPTAEHRLAVCEGLLRKAEAEVARLREEHAEWVEKAFKDAEWHREQLAAERAAHELEKRERERNWQERNDARARVTELERKNEGLGRAKDKFASRAYLAEARVTELEGALRVVSDRAVSEALLRQDAIDQARGLLESAIEYAGGRWCEWGARAEGVLERLEELQGVLSSSPAPATPTPDEEPRCNECGMQLASVAGDPRETWTCVRCDDQQVTPAATGVNRLQELEAKIARVQALIDDSVDERHGPGGCGIYACSLREALK